MTLPSSGQISLKDILDEKQGSTTARTNISLTGLSVNGTADSSGGDITVNSSSSSKPDGSAPHEVSEFYGYTQTPPPALTYTNSRRSFLVDETVSGSDSEARAFVWCYRTGTTIKVYVRLQGNGDAGGGSAVARSWPNLGQGGTIVNLGGTFHNTNYEFAQITNVDSGYKVGFSDGPVSGLGQAHASDETFTYNMDAGTSPTTSVSTTFWTASAGSTTQDTPPSGINAVRYTSFALEDFTDSGYDRVTLHFRHATLTDFDVVVDIDTAAEGVAVDIPEEDCPQCCIHESMLIATEEDMKSIHDIKIGDKVISYNFETQSNELVEVEDLITIERDVDYKVNNLILTEDHPVYLNTGKKASINPEATLLNYKQEVDQIQIGDIMVKLDGTEEVIESIEKYEGTHLNYAIKTKHNNFYADGILVDSVIQEKK